MSHRYYHPTIAPGELLTLEGAEAHHLLHVMRAEVGDKARLFDGRGGEYQATVAALRRNLVDFEVGARLEVDRELSRRVVVGVALPKGDRQKWLVEKLTELGTARLVPLVTSHGTVKLHDRGEEKLERAVIEASKQCGRNVLMEVAAPQSLEEYISSAEGLRLMAHPGGEARLAEEALPAVVSLAIGPEGGFTEEEIAMADRHGWRRVGLGPAILRIETAAVAMVARIGG